MFTGEFGAAHVVVGALVAAGSVMVCVLAWWLSKRSAPRPTELGLLSGRYEKEYTLLLEDLDTAERLYTFARGPMRKEVLDQVADPTLTVPPIVARVHCPMCCAAVRLMVPHKVTHVSVLAHQARLGTKDCFSSHRCPITARDGSLAFMVYLLRRAAETATVVKDSECSKGTPQLEGKGFVRAVDKRKPKRKPVINSGSCDVFLGPQGELTSTEKADRLRQRLDDLEAERDMIAQSGDYDPESGGSRGDAALYMRLERDRAAIEQQLRGLSSSSNQKTWADMMDEDDYQDDDDYPMREGSKKKSATLKLQAELSSKYDTWMRDANDNVELNEDVKEQIYAASLGYIRIAGATREGVSTVTVCDDTKFSVIARTALPDFRQQQLEESRRLVDAHREVVLKMIDDEPVREASTTLPGNGEKTLDVCSVAVLLPDGTIRGASYHQNQGKVLLCTHRHGIGGDAPIHAGDVIQVVFMANCPPKMRACNLPWETCNVVSTRAHEGEDQQWLYTDMDKPTHLDPADVKMPKPQDVVHQTCLRITGEWAEWKTARGQVTDVRGNVVFYDFGTEAGDCGYPVVRGSNPLCTHLYGRVRDGSNSLTNAGELLKKPPVPKKGESDLPFLDVSASLGVRQNNPFYRCRQWKRRIEQLQIKGLRWNIPGRMAGFKPKHFWMKPSTDMNKVEVLKFMEPLGVEIDHDALMKALQVLVMYDQRSSISRQFHNPTYEDVMLAIHELPTDRNAGFAAGGLKLGEYLKELGGGDPEAGKEVLAQRVLRLYDDYLNGRDTALTEQMMRWVVLGKRDGYLEKKLPPKGSGRTIQAPCVELKVLHLVMFGESDQAWLDRGGNRADEWVHQGEDADRPVSAAKVHVLRQALSCVAGDVSGYDRRMHAALMAAYFMCYLPLVVPGVPLAVCAAMAKTTIHSHLVLSSGEAIQKHWGNPSGYMNTLRMNCVVHLLSMIYVYIMRTGASVEQAYHFFTVDVSVEICGDDSRVFALTPNGHNYLDAGNECREYLAGWTVLPWEVKLEGCTVYNLRMTLRERCEATPPMVSRRYVLVDGVVWDPLVNVSRVLKRLSCAEVRSEVLEKDLIRSAFNSLALHVDWQDRKVPLFYSSAVEYLLTAYGRSVEGVCYVHDAKARAAALREHALVRQKVVPPSGWNGPAGPA